MAIAAADLLVSRTTTLGDTDDASELIVLGNTMAVDCSRRWSGVSTSAADPCGVTPAMASMAHVA